MKQRVLTALLVTPSAIAMIFWTPTPYLAALIGVLCVIALWEWTRLVGMRTRPARCAYVGINAAAMALLWLYRGGVFWWLTIGAGLVWWQIAICWLRHFSFAAAPTRENTALKLCAGSLAVLPAWAALMGIHGKQPDGPAWGLYALVLVWSADIFAYLAGSRWGTTKLAPRISPGKTIAGVYGALVGSALVAVLGGWLLDERGAALFALVLLALVSVAFSIVGDLFESLIKRHSNVKDSGTLFPGHGGVFDRLDSVFAALPVFAIGKVLFDL